MFDRQFQQLWKASNVHVKVDDAFMCEVGDGDEQVSDETSIIVSWDDCEMADYFCSNNPHTILEYTAEISPDTEMPIKSFQYYKSLNTSLLPCIMRLVANCLESIHANGSFIGHCPFL